jgi:HlyD family secretion protein
LFFRLTANMGVPRLQAMTKWQIVGLVGAVLLLLGIAFFAYDFVWRSKIKPEFVKNGSFVQTIVASGRVESPHRISISAQITGTVSDVPVVEGQSVEKGQLLIALENTELHSALRQAQASEQQALSNLRQLRELKAPVAVQLQIQADANFANAKNNLARTLELFHKGFIGAAARDESERAFQIAQSQRNIDRQQYESLQPGGSEMSLVQATVNQARAAVQTATARLRYSTIQAPRAGILIARHVEIGDGVLPGKVLMTLSPKGVMQLVVQIDEKNIKWLQINQMALASADAFPDKKFQAQLVYINPSIDPQRGSVEVKLDIKDPPPELKQDMTVSVDIETARIENTLLIPMSAVHDYDIKAPWVFLIHQGKAQKQAISLGLESHGLVQVLSGLKAGDRVIPLKYTQIRDRSRVRLAS